MTLLSKLLTIQREVRSLRANGNANGYAYLKGEKLLDFIRPKMDELGLLLQPEITGIDNTIHTYKLGSGKDKTEVLTTLHMKFTWIDTESAETLSSIWAANGQNGFDKGAGSAMTYGERYFLLKFFHISTDEDDVDQPAQQPAANHLEDLVTAVEEMEKAATQDELKKVWNKYKGLQTAAAFLAAAKKRKGELAQ
jgi:hypothetical protein